MAPVKLDLLFVSGGLPHDGATLKNQSLGGSETACLHLSRELAKRGHHVTVASPTRGGVWDDVTFMPLESAPGYASVMPIDVCILSRNIEWCRWLVTAKLRVLWCHDLALKRSRPMLAGTLWNIDTMYVLSEFHKKQYIEVHGEHIAPLLWQTRNGIDLPSFAGLSNTARDRNLLVYGSRPERGWGAALAIMELLARKGSDLRLEIAGYENSVPQLQPMIDHYKAVAQRLPNVKFIGALRQDEWHRKIASSLALMYPGCDGDFSEISCLVAAEAQACGTPIVSLDKGALSETIGDAGILLKTDSVGNPQYLERFADTLIGLHKDIGETQRLAQNGLRHAQQLGWAGVAEAWEQDWLRRLEAPADSWRLARHFRRMGDHEAAEEMRQSGDGYFVLDANEAA